MKRAVVVRLCLSVMVGLLAGQCLAAEKLSGVKGMEARCAKYFTDAKSIKQCMRDERRATMDIYDLIDELGDAGKPMKEASTSKEFENEAVQKGKYFAACATMFELHKDRVDCYRSGVQAYQEKMKARLSGKAPFAEP
jgi:hypothetical protein